MNPEQIAESVRVWERMVTRLANRRRPIPRPVVKRFWYPNYWYEVSPLYGLDRNEAMLCEIGERAAELGDFEASPDYARQHGYFGWADEMNEAKAP
jgi:hypothetical protein